MKVNKHIAGALAGFSLLVVAMGAKAIFAQRPAPHTPPAAAQQKAGSDDHVQSPSYNGSIMVDQAQFKGMSEADEAAALQKMATISADRAKAAAEAAHPGATAVKVELDNENGALVYSVELSNGVDVKVDAGNGKILHTEQAGEDVQEEHGSQADDGTEASGEEYAVEQ